MSLASHLLKHYAISKALDLPWGATTISRNAKTKPVYMDPATGRSPIDFNVSHQAGLVALVAAHGHDAERLGPVDVGCDVVCVSERADRDRAMIAREGWPSFVDVHADVFAPGEAAHLKSRLGAPPAGAGVSDATAFRLRCFYTLWCLREAYIKMTGDALLAPWLKELEFRGFRAPLPQGEGGAAREDEGDVVTGHDVWFQGGKVDDANVCLRSVGPDYMTCTAVRTPRHKEVGLGIELGAYDVVKLDEILEYAESRL